MKQKALLLAGLMGLACVAAPQQKSADWVQVAADPVVIAKRAQDMYKNFVGVHPGKGVFGKAKLNGKTPSAADPLGYGYLSNQPLNVYFWSPKKFQISYLVYGKIPSQEFIWSDGAGKMMRLGPFVGEKNKIFSIKQHLFDVKSDEELVEKWPIDFTKYLYSPFFSGNATLTRYVAALKRGVGGYKVTVWTRGNPDEYRIFATREKSGKRPASTVEMIFMDAKPYLPVIIHTTYGQLYDLIWRMGWYNDWPLPASPSTIKD
ncbi:MAG TPA: hypothetical protein VHE55_04155 [Fimbriimonadaceae bacterium]|nr:hypothetical protein [Fimbriimonadaceae bacterium]